MANTINYAEAWSSDLLQLIDDGAYSSPFLAPAEAVKFTGAKTFHFTRMATSGYKAHSRNGGWNNGSVTQTDETFTLTHDRDIQFLVDAADVDESKQTANIQNISADFTKRNAAPETDARFFEQVSQVAIEDELYSVTASWTKANVYSNLVDIFNKPGLKKYRAMGGLIAYVSGTIMDLLAKSSEITKTFDIKTASINEGSGINTRITSINGVTIIEVVDDDRFYTKFDYSDGFEADDDGKALNVLVAHPSMVKTVEKISSIYFFPKGTHTAGDGDLYQNRALWDTFVFPNAKDGSHDAVWIDCSTDPAPAT